MFLLHTALSWMLVLPVASAADRPEAPGAAPSQHMVALPAPSASIAAALDEVAKSWLFRKADVGLHVVDLSTGEEVFAKGADAPLVPASTMKVVTAAAALHHLGPAWRFTTEVYHDGEIDGAGVLRGNLYVKGHGDPTFVIEKLWKLVWDLELAGIERIEGNVVFDESYHGGGYALPGWNKREDVERGTPYFATLSALSINANTVNLVVGPGAEVGAAARVVLETPTVGYVEIDNQVKTGAPGSRRWVDVTRTATADATRFELTGSVPAGDPERTRIRRTVADPTAHFIAAFRAQMEAQGVAVTGKYRRGELPATAELLMSVESPPLASVLADMNKYSLNFVAEQVLRSLGAEVGGEGTTEGGLRVVSAYLEGLGVPASDFRLVNGSGLSREMRMKASVLTAVLFDMARDPQVGAEFDASLAIGGTDGTLWSRLRDEPGRLRGKTGTLDEVHCLAGYLDSDGGRRYAFAFLVNNHGGRTQAVRDVHDQFARSVSDLGGGPGQGAP